MAGRPQESSRSGPTYKLAAFMNCNWEKMVGRTNEDVAGELGYKAPNMISMWRTGKTRVPLERLPDVARLMKVDIATLFPLWFDQQWGEREDVEHLATLFDRFATVREFEVLSALRKAMPSNPMFTPEMVEAVVAVASNQVLRGEVIAKLRSGVPV
jgi:transcriptional regulator with XRE-family HTH domain